MSILCQAKCCSTAKRHHVSASAEGGCSGVEAHAAGCSAVWSGMLCCCRQTLLAADQVLSLSCLQARSTAEILHQKHQEDDAKVANVDASVSAGPAEAPRSQTVLRVRSYQLSFLSELSRTWACSIISCCSAFAEFQLAHRS